MTSQSLSTQPQNEVTVLYQPFPEQAAFHNDRYNIRHRAVFSGVGGGKTLCGCFEIIMMLLENPGAVGYIFEPTYKMVRRILIPTLESKLLLGHPIESNPIVDQYRRGDNCITFIDGQELWFGGLEEPEYAEGANVDVSLIDEGQYIKKFAESQDVVLRRLRGSGKTDVDITSSILTTSPPPLIPDCRMYDFYENPETRNPDTRVYRWSMLQNIHLTDAYKQEMVASHHGSQAKRFIEGLFAPIGTGSYDYNSITHEVLIKDGWITRKCDNTKLLMLNDLSTIVYGVDFGWTNPSAVACIGFDGDDRAYILDEFYQNRTQTETLISELNEMQQKWGKGKIVCDRSQPQTIDQLRRAGLHAVADSSKREDGLNEVGGRYYVQQDGKPRIYVANTCVNFIHEVMVYNIETKENDHLMDACRYGILSKTRQNIQVSRGKVPW